MPEDKFKVVANDIAGRAGHDILDDAIKFSAETAKRELAHRYGGHIEEPFATPGCGVFEPLHTVRSVAQSRMKRSA